MKINEIYQGDSAIELKNIATNSIDLIVTDPPYGIAFMGKFWDKALPSLEIFKECHRVLKSGAFAFIMSSPRQDVLSRMIIRLEDAGFKTNFTSIYWAYSTGFPKSQDASKLINKKFGVEREIITEPDIARKFKGSYVGFQPKPSIEVIICAMKPLSEKTYVEQVIKNGKGVTWFDTCRIPFANQTDVEITERKTRWDDFSCGKDNRGNNVYCQDKSARNKHGNYSASKGRFPANLLISDNILDDDIERTSCQSKKKHEAYESEKVTGFLKGDSHPGNQYNDSGGFSRFFSLDSWWEKKIKELPEKVQKTFPYLLVTKPTKKEKNKGCEEINGNTHVTVKPIKLFSYLITLGSRKNDIILDPFSGSGTTGIAALLLNRNYILIDIEPENIIISEARIKTWKKEFVEERRKQV